MALTVVFENDETGTLGLGNYNVTVLVNNRVIARDRIEGHPRSRDWIHLVRRLVSTDGTLDGLYCGIELTGGWCKRPKGH